MNHLSNNNNKRTKKKPQCPDCKETNDCVNLFSNKVNRIEEIVNSFYKNSSKIYFE